MTFPTGTQISTTHLDSGDDDPSLARADIYAAVQALNQLIASENAALGVLVLDASGKVAASRLPNSYTVTGNVTLSPSTGIVNVNRVLRLQQTVTADLGTDTGTTSPTAGDLVYLTDGDAGSPCLGVYDGSAWKIVRFMTTVGDTVVTTTTTATLTATAVA
jgi:hypothetical protein